MSREIRLRHERVAGVALLVGVLLPLYFLLTGFVVTGGSGTTVDCPSTVTALARSRATPADPTAACHHGAVARLHLAGGYATACGAVALLVWIIGGARERALNRAWTGGRVPSRWLSTPGQLWTFAALLFLVLVPAVPGAA